MAEKAEEGTPYLDADTRSALAEVVALQGARWGDEQPHSEADIAALTLLDEQPIVRIANTILQSAIKEGASDIHIDPSQHNVTVRFRIDGVLHEVMRMPGFITLPLVQRYKVLADVDLLVRDRPQLGQIGTRYDNQIFEVRVQTFPTRHGEKILLHITAEATPYQKLGVLGLTSELEERLHSLIWHRRGMLVLTGGRRQGCTTTQYAILQRLTGSPPWKSTEEQDKNLERWGGHQSSAIAIANSYDYSMKDVSQTRLNPKCGYTEAAALASVANLDTDVIALDHPGHEATRIALEMAVEPRIVLDILDASSAENALARLRSYGIADPLITTGVTGVLTQKLVRRLCTSCKETYLVNASHLRRFGYKMAKPDEMVELTRGKGCDACFNTGYREQIALFELLTVDSTIAQMIVDKARFADIVTAAKANGMYELREDGLIKVLQGLTTPEEVVRVLPTMA